MNAILRCCYVAVAVICFAVFLACSGGVNYRAQDELAAPRMSKDFVKRHLTYPNNASFGWTATESAIDATGRTNWQCTGTVDAMNAFGATITYDWQTVVTKIDGTWHPVMVSLDGEIVYVNEEIFGTRLAELENNTEQQGPIEYVEQQSPYEEPLYEEPVQARADLVRERRTRTWTDKAGKFSVHAELVAYGGGTLYLKKDDGSIVEVPLTKISMDDREFLQNEIKDADLLPKSPPD